MLLFALLSLARAAPEAPPDWEVTLEQVVPAVVSLQVSSTRPFDTEGASSSEGTGFVVDAQRGILLTNRHMVEPGPVVAKAVFQNHEEVALQAVYRDPVHDFGFYRFNPEDVRYMDLVELPLVPEAAKVGVDIRVIGNDAGEKISILSGTLARLDRAAPHYSGNGYNDFNTFYYQAASSTSGGSSGSPVVELSGRVVALNAGGSVGAASSFYLPLHRVVRALKLIQEQEPIPRGTLQTIFRYTAFDELRRLGLTEETETGVRAEFQEGTGMLVVRQVLPAGPAQNILEPGDILLRVDGEWVSTFLPLEEALDAKVGEALELEVERGGESLVLSLEVGDLHSITPDAFLEFGSVVINALSYQQARNHVIPVEGLYVANPGFTLGSAGVPDGALIREVAGEPVPDLDSLWEVLSAQPHGARVPVRYSAIRDPRREQVAVLEMDRLWFPMQRCHRDDATGLWPCTQADPPPEPEALAPATASRATTGRGPVRKLAASLVVVDFDIPYRTEGVWGSHFRGAGLVVDAERGLVLVDRDTVPIPLGNLALTFGGSVRIPGKVEFVHPLHNFSVISYDPALLGETQVKSAKLKTTPLEAGDRVFQVGITRSHEVVSRRTRVARIEPVVLPLPSPPQFRDVNLEVIDTHAAAPSVGGALTDYSGAVVALWASFPYKEDGDRNSFFRGIPTENFLPVLEALKAGGPAVVRSLGAELAPLPLADARELGLKDTRAQALEAASPGIRRALMVSRLTEGTQAAERLEEGDLLLSIDGVAVSRFIDLERASQKPLLQLELLRNGEEIQVELPTEPLYGQGVDEIAIWAGVLLHAPHRELASQRGLSRNGVYVGFYWYGSPAARYRLRATRRIIEVNGTPTPDLDAFFAVLAENAVSEPVRLTTLDLDDQVRVVTMELDPHYWPTRRFKLQDGVWAPLEPGDQSP